MENNYNFFLEKGYVILKNVFSNEEIDYINNYTEDFFVIKNKKIVIEEYIGTINKDAHTFKIAPTMLKINPIRLTTYFFMIKVLEILYQRRKFHPC